MSRKTTSRWEVTAAESSRALPGLMPLDRMGRMRYRTFGDSDVTASEVGFGMWTVSTGWWGDVSDERAVELIRAAFDAGITLFDSADAYAEGRADRLLARALKD